jgi:hypothetical protein
VSADDVHLSIDQLADFGADAMPQAEAAAAQAHLRSCDDCRATNDLLAGVPALLAGAAVVPIPAEVNARVVAAIEREQIARAGAPHEVPARTSTSTSTSQQRVGARRRFGARLGAGLLGATAVLGGGYLVASGVLGGGSDDSPSAGMAEDAAQAPTASGSGEGPVPTRADTDGLAFRSATFDDDVQRLLTLEPGYADTSRTPAETVQGQDGEIGDPDDVATKTRACVAATQREAGTQDDPVAVDLGTYDGVSAVVVVLPGGAATATAATYDVWVLGTNCVDKTDAEFQSLFGSLQVLRHESVRP